MSSVKTTTFVLTIGDPVFDKCMDALNNQTISDFRIEIIRNISPVSAADQKMINSCSTDYFIKVDEDMILNANAIERMQEVIDAAEDKVAMINFSLYDEDLEKNIHGIKIFRTSAMKNVEMRNRRASDIDLAKQLNSQGFMCVDFPEVVGSHGVYYTPETIYRRYKSMYEKEVFLLNRVDGIIAEKARKYRDTGDINQLFALLGAYHGILNTENIDDTEAKDVRKYNMKELEILKKLLIEGKQFIDYDNDRVVTYDNILTDIHKVKWKKKITPVTQLFKSRIQQPFKELSSSNPSVYRFLSRIYHRINKLFRT